MLKYTLRRILLMIPTLLVISFLTFAIIKLPPGDFLTNRIAELQSQGDRAAMEKAAFLSHQYGLDRPFIEQYATWVGIWPTEEGFSGLLQGNWGWSFEYDLPVKDVVGDRMLLTFILNFFTILFTFAIAFPIGIYAATRQYSLGDYSLTLLGYVGLAAPNFLLALVLMYFANVQFGMSIGGIMDPQYLDQPWSWAKAGSVMQHLWIPVLVIGTAGTAAMIRRLRANLLDELQKQYVVTARAKGVPPFRLLIKYPLRMSLNPFISDIGNLLPSVVSGSAIVSVVLSLQTVGPMLLDALQSQDQYLAGSFLMFLSLLTVIGVFISDLLLAALDPHTAQRRGDQVNAPAENAARLDHFVSQEPFAPHEADALTSEQERFYQASQWRIMWWKFRRHRVAVVSAVILALFYVSTLICEFLAPYHLHTRDTRHIYAPPQEMHLFHEGRLVGPFVYGYKMQLDMTRLVRIYTPDPAKVYPLRFLCRGDPYEFWGLVEANLHLFCPAEDGVVFLMGTDRLGRDLLSRIIYGTRISLTVGLLGIIVSFVIGLTLGGISGYFGGWVDTLIQRFIEMMRSFPELPLWMALSAALPVTWSPVLVYFGITIILGLLDWPGLARAVRSKLLALREEDFASAAVLMGAGPGRVIRRHLLPSFTSHLIASLTLSVPGMILGETALSFLGIGLRPPVTSWGVLLNEAQNVNVVALYPWLMLTVVPVFIVVLAFNFMGDGMRDAADPYS